MVLELWTEGVNGMLDTLVDNLFAQGESIVSDGVGMYFKLKQAPASGPFQAVRLWVQKIA